jgi:group I intron endonuclease
MGNKKEKRVPIVGIYKITNQINGKAYVGQATNIRRRWNKHKSNAFNQNSDSYDSAICCAIRRHGVDNFIFEIIEECSANELDQREIYWIDYYDTYHKGYNETLGGGGSKKEPDKRALGIINDLETTKMTHKEIAEKWDVSKTTVDNINTGRTYYQENRKYPIQEYEMNRKGEYYCVICGKEIGKRSTYCFECYNTKRKQENLEKQSVGLKTKKCCMCGVLITKRATYCAECIRKEQSKNQPTKDELFKLILQHSFLQIGKKYNVSDNAVRKWCKKYGLPTKYKEVQQLRQEYKNVVEK